MISKLDQIIRALEALSSDTASIKRQALNIHAAMIAHTNGFEIEHRADGNRVRPRWAKPTGPAKELRDLAAAARKAIAGKITNEDWTKIWLAQPRYIGRACRPTLLVPGKRSMDKSKLLPSFSAPRFTAIVPKPEIVLPAIVRQQQQPRTKSRKPDMTARDAIAVIRAAYQELTGNKGGRVPHDGKLSGRFISLGREIDRIFGTKLFPRTDSVRLRIK